MNKLYLLTVLLISTAVQATKGKQKLPQRDPAKVAALHAKIQVKKDQQVAKEACLNLRGKDRGSLVENPYGFFVIKRS